MCARTTRLNPGETGPPSHDRAGKDGGGNPKKYLQNHSSAFEKVVVVCVCVLVQMTLSRVGIPPSVRFKR
jgi:hypothetical protein